MRRVRGDSRWPVPQDRAQSTPSRAKDGPGPRRGSKSSRGALPQGAAAPRRRPSSGRRLPGPQHEEKGRARRGSGGRDRRRVRVGRRQENGHACPRRKDRCAAFMRSPAASPAAAAAAEAEQAEAATPWLRNSEKKATPWAASQVGPVHGRRHLHPARRDPYDMLCEEVSVPLLSPPPEPPRCCRILHVRRSAPRRPKHALGGGEKYS